MKKQMLFGEFRELVAKDMGVPLEQQRFWTFAKRQNSTVRCYSLSHGAVLHVASMMLWYLGFAGCTKQCPQRRASTW